MIRTRTHQSSKHGLRREFSGDRIIRIPLGPKGRLYAYICAGAMLGSLVRVRAPLSGTVTARVVALGRGGWKGPLKRATLVHR